nr:NAD-dependent epimerase [Allomuricauda sp.]
MRIVITGAAGFIGYHTCRRLVSEGHEVIGIDNINDYYDTALKYSRLKELGISEKAASNYGLKTEGFSSDGFPFVFYNTDIHDFEGLHRIFKEHQPDTVCHLAAQAGVRYSLENPRAYIDNNIIGFFNLLECCKSEKIKHLVYASSSSVYGNNRSIPFKTSDNVDHPISLYAATKKSNELMAHTYSHLYKLPTTGLRFFTVYGPYGRPDMATFLFTDAILKEKPIKVFNSGKMERDFTYVDDIVEGVVRVLLESIEHRRESKEMYKIYNIGNNQSVKLLDFILEIEKQLGKKAIMDLLPMQAGDVERTWADVGPLIKDYGYSPNTPIEKGVKAYIEWHKKFYGL